MGVTGVGDDSVSALGRIGNDIPTQFGPFRNDSMCACDSQNKRNGDWRNATYDFKRQAQPDVIGGRTDEQFVLAGFHDKTRANRVPISQSADRNRQTNPCLLSRTHIRPNETAQRLPGLWPYGIKMATINLRHFVAV